MPWRRPCLLATGVLAAPICPTYSSSSCGAVSRESTPGAKPGEEEDNKVRCREQLSFFHGSASLSGTGGEARLRAIARSRPPPRNRGRSGFDSVSSRLTPCCFAPLPLRDGGDFAGTRSMRRGAADGIACGRIDGQIVVGPLRAERIIARGIGLRGRLPPAMLAHDHTPINIGVQQRPSRIAPVGVSMLTQSPAAMPRRVAVAGCDITSGSIARRRRLGSARCWV
jgi:hypothetical protein